MLASVDAPWAWIIGGLLLAACELVVPGAFLIWIGLAAVATGLAAAAVTLPWEVALLLFAALAVAAVLIGRRTTRSAVSDLNRRGENLVGREFTLDGPIAAGTGRLALGDTTWRITGADCPAGSRVRVARLDGTTLVVVSADEGGRSM